MKLGSLDLESLRLPSLDALAGLSERDRRMLAIGAVALVAILLFGVMLPLDRSVSHARERLQKKRADLVWMQSVAPELASAGPAPAANGESLLVIVDRSARESGLGSSLAGSEPGGPGSLSVRLEKAPFDTLIAWLARLSQQSGVAVDSATIERAGGPGLVNAAIVLHQ
ncbi:MAG: type II secretion system protein M [Proteobacteria bacterium]|nr:type II secretion system protein M [Pseudomonadota bacterium]